MMGRDLFVVVKHITQYYLVSYLFFRFYRGWGVFGDSLPEYCAEGSAGYQDFHAVCLESCFDPAGGVGAELAGTYGFFMMDGENVKLNGTNLIINPDMQDHPSTSQIHMSVEKMCDSKCDDPSNVCSGHFVSDAMILEFIVVTMSTVGYGNVAPTTNLGRMFWAFGLPYGIFLLGRFGSVVIDGYMDRLAAQKASNLMANSLCSIEELQQFDESGDGKVDKFEWLKVMLPKLQYCTSEQIDSVMRRFNEIDEDNSGEITVEDFRLMKEARRQRSLRKSGKSAMLAGNERKPRPAGSAAQHMKAIVVDGDQDDAVARSASWADEVILVERQQPPPHRSA